ncbi:hypothetical protein ACVBEG_27540 [Pseudomonas sp. GG8]
MLPLIARMTFGLAGLSASPDGKRGIPGSVKTAFVDLAEFMAGHCHLGVSTLSDSCLVLAVDPACRDSWQPT